MVALSLHKFFQKYPDSNAQENFAVAVSGGPDSMALAHMVCLWGGVHQKKIHFLTVDHGLRKEAADEAKMIDEWVESLKLNGICHSIFKWEGDKPKTSIMEVARQARYELMGEYCDQHHIQSLFIGHHQDDQAETFLMRLSKGSGLDGLAAMAPISHYNKNLQLVRPLLETSKADLVEYCDENKIPYVMDPSNRNENYLRPRLRNMRRALEEEGMSAKRLSITAKRIARGRSALENISKKIFKQTLQEQTDQKFMFDFDQLKQQPEEIGLRVVQSALENMRPESHYQVRLEKLEELFESLWFDPQNFKPRTLGGCKFSLKCDKTSQNTALYIEKEET